MTTDINELARRVERIISDVKLKHGGNDTYAPVMKWDEFLALVEALEKAQQHIARQEQILLNQDESLSIRRGELEAAHQRIAQLESRTVKLPDGWQFEECEIEGCENGAIFSVGTGSRNIHLCDKCAHEPQNSRLKKSPLSKRLPFKMSAGIKWEVE